jgi:hypothetical protein
MTASPQPRYDDPEPTGLVLFAGVVMFINGTLSALYGLAAILNDEVVTVGGRGVMIWDFTTWGWVILVFGVLVALVGAGLLMHRTEARWLAVVLVTMHAIAYFGTVSAFPLWALLIIGLDVLILYQLLARWPTTS